MKLSRTILKRCVSRSLSDAVPIPVVRNGPISGRFANTGLNITVFGAYGFVGRYFVEELAQSGARVYVPFRGCEMEIRHLKPMFDLGQLGLLPFSPRDEASIEASLANSDIVINLIGKYYETKHAVPTRRADGSLSRVNYSFDEVHSDIPRTIARLAKKHGVQHFIHMSALSANLESKSSWCRSKAKGETAVREEFPEAIIVRPATIFGPEDRFLNLIAETAERLPFSPLVNNGANTVQPVYSVDVGKGLMSIVNNIDTFSGATFEFTGPAEYSYKEIVEFVSDVTTVKKPLVDVPVPVVKLAGELLDTQMSPLFTRDSLNQLLEDNVATNDPSVLNLKDLNLKCASLDHVAFDYLHRFRPGGHFDYVQGYY